MAFVQLPDDCLLAIFGRVGEAAQLSACRRVCAGWARALALAAAAPVWRRCAEPSAIKIALSQRGCLRATAWLDTVLGFTAADARVRANYPLRCACARGHLEDAEWLVDRFGLTAKDKCAVNSDAFWEACMGGHAQVARWLEPLVPRTRESRRRASRALLVSSVRGYLETTILLGSIADPNDDDIGDAFCASCSRGHLELADWFLGTYGHTRWHTVRALGAACGAGNLDAAKWLVGEERPTVEEIRRDNNEILRTTCRFGHADMARWLVAEFGLETEDARALQHYSLKKACKYGHIEIVEWLVADMDIEGQDALDEDQVLADNSYDEEEDPEDLVPEESCAMVLACEYGHMNIVQYLFGNFRLITDESDVWARCMRAAGGERLDLVKYIYDKNPTFHEELHIVYGDMFEEARQKDDFNTMHVLLNTAGYVPPDSSSTIDLLHKLCGSYGSSLDKHRLGVAKLLYERSAIDFGEFRPTARQILADACRWGNHGMVEWLTEIGLDEDDIRANPYALGELCAHGSLETIKLLDDLYGLTAQDLTAGDLPNKPLRRALERGHLHVAEWIVPRCGRPSIVNEPRDSVLAKWLASRPAQ